MTKKTQPTDDASFRDYLNSLCHNTLFEHARETILPDIIIEIMLRYKNLYQDYISMLADLGIDIDSENKAALKETLETELNNIDENDMKEIMLQLFSKKLVIDMIFECTDQYAREDIIYNQNYWNEGVDLKLNLN
jgi:hypothetical protein